MVSATEQQTAGREKTDLPYGANSQGCSLSHIITQHYQESKKSDVTFLIFFPFLPRWAQESEKEKSVH